MFSLFELDKQSLIDARLHQAISSGVLEIVKECINKGANLASIINKTTPIEKAALLNKQDIVLLIATLKKTDSEDSYRYSAALEHAVFNDYEFTATALIMAGARLDKSVRDINSANILHLAVEMRHYQVIKNLIRLKPDLLKKDSAEFNTPLVYVAKLAERYLKKENNLIQANEYWKVVQFLIPLVKEAVENELLFGLWGKLYGLNESLIVAASCGNIPVMTNLLNAGAILHISRLENLYSALDLALENGHLCATALCLYLCPGLETKHYVTQFFTFGSPLNQSIIKDGNFWAQNIHIFIKKCTLLLQAFSSLSSIFWSLPKELYPRLIMNFILAMAKDLYFNVEKNIVHDQFNINLSEQQIDNSLSNINSAHKVLSIVKGYEKQFTSLSFFRGPKTLDTFIQQLKQQDNAKSIKNFIQNFVRNRDNWENNNLIKDFLLEHHLIENSDLTAKDKATSVLLLKR